MAVLRLSVLICSTMVVMADHTPLHDMAQSNIAFAKKLYRALIKTPSCDEGVVFSPLALQAGLAATYLGAGGVTAQELVSGLSFNSKQLGRMPQGFLEGFQSILKESRLKYASGIFAANTVDLEPEFQKSTKRSFFTEVLKKNFHDYPETAEDEINKWADVKTDGLVTTLALKDSVNKATQLLLASGVHYDGVWRDPAVTPVSNTKNATYNLRYSGRVLTGLLSDLGLQVIQIPYQLTPESSKSKGLKLMLIVPIDAQDGFLKLHNNFDKINLETIEEELFAMETQLLVTNLDMEQTHSMKEILQKIGIVNIFEDSADLKGVSQGSLKMDDVLHTASIKMLDERNASTDTDDISTDKNDKVIFALSSYIFILQDPTSKAIVLMGRRSCSK